MREKLINLIADEFNLSPGMLTLESRFDALDIDSLDFLELILRVQRDFSCDIPDAIISHIETVQQLENAILGAATTASA